MKNTPPFHYLNGQLHCDRVPVAQIANEIGTPFYVYSADHLKKKYQRIAAAFSPLHARICYSVKANTNLSILRLLNEAGSSFDIVSGGELYRTLKAGVPAKKIVFAGVGKTQSELVYAVQSQVGWFNVESIEEAIRLNNVAEAQHQTVNVALRLRPGIEAGGHPYIVTGSSTSKFGMSLTDGFDLILRAADLPHLFLGGVHIHIGSQLADPSATLAAIDIVIDFIKNSGLADTTRKRGVVPTLNIGGGFPIPYRESEPVAAIEDFADPIVARLQPLVSNLDFVIEPGRFISADSGSLILTIQYRKEVDGQCMLVVDAGINALMRPALYGAYHRVLPLSHPLPTDIQTLVTIVGPICESADVLARERTLPHLTAGNRLAILDTGAYGFSMASNYNSQPRPAEVLVEGETFRLIRRRETFSDLVAGEEF